jgi:hypothetical protein
MIGMAGLCLLAGLILCAAPGAAEAGKVGFQNQLTTSVNLDSYLVTVIRGKQVTARGATLQIDSGEVSGYANVPANCVLVIEIYDANKPSRLLYRGSTPVGTAPLFFAVQPTANPKKAKLVPTMPPKIIPVKPSR